MLLMALLLALVPAAAWAEDDVAADDSFTVYTYESSAWTSTEYTDFEEAVDACNEYTSNWCYIALDSDLTLTEDVSITTPYFYGLMVTDEVTLDLGGHTLTFSSYYYSIYVSGTSASLTLTNGTIKDTAKASGYETISVMNGAALETSDLTVETTAPSSGANYIVYSYTYSGGTQSVTLGEGTTLESMGDSDGESGYVYGVAIMGVDSDTTATTGNSLTLDGATITTSYFAIAGNGSVHGTTITISDSTITSTAGTAIYLPQNGTTTIYDSTITGVLSGIEIRAGVLSIYGDTTVTSTATTFSATDNGGSGTTVTGAAIAVSQHSTNIDISVTISGGTYTGLYAVYENDLMDESSSNIIVSLEGGTYTTTSTVTDAAAVSAADTGTLTISGGTYSVTPASSYLDSHYSVTTVTDDDGTTTYVVTSNYEASYTTTDDDGNTTVAYDTLANALSKVSSGGTVTLLKDVTASVTVSSAVTLDLNGHTLTNTDGSHTITVASGGDLTVVDSSYAGTGVVDNVTTKCAALYVAEGGTATLQGGTFRRSAETGTSTNTYYTILNQGTLTIADGTTVELLKSDGTAATYSSVIDNGWPSGSPETEGDVATLYITGGYITGGKYVKNDSYGVMYISGGTITNGSANGAILNWNVLTITGGTIENSAYAIFNCATDGTDYETGTVTITGGTFTYGKSLLTSGSTSEDVTVSGGSFSTVVDSLYCADGYVPATEQDEDGLYTVATGTFVASLSNASGTLLAKYTDLQEALDAAGSGYTVALLGDLTITDSYLMISSSLTLDLGGYELTFATSSAVYSSAIFISDGDVVLTNGTITDKRSYGYTLYGTKTIWMYGESLETSDLTIQTYAPNSTSGYNYILYIQSDASATSPCYPSVTLGSGTSIVDLGNSHATSGYSTHGCVGVTILGAYSTSALDASAESCGIDSSKIVSLTVEDGVTITTQAFAITGNGSYHGTSITIEGGSITSTGSTAIYHPQYGTLTVSGGTITGVDAGIEIRAGELTVSGGTITATAETFSAAANGSGTTVTGAAVAVSQHTTNLPLSVAITGGTLTGYYALYEADLQDESTDDIELSVTGGTFVSTSTDDSAQAIYSADCTGFVGTGTTTSGATTTTTYPVSSTAIDAMYCAEGYVPTATQTVTVDGVTYYTIETGEFTAVLTVDGEIVSKYLTVQDALDAAAALTLDDDEVATVTLYTDATEDVTVSSTVTIDLNGCTLTNASGHTITVAAGGNLTVVDSSEDASGAVDNVTHQKAALYVAEGGTATLQGGTFRRSAEAAYYDEDADAWVSGGNSYYTILNQGTLTIADGTTVELLTASGEAAGYSSVIDNGWPSGSPSTSGDVATLYITGGTVTGGKYVKNDSYGVMYISGGTITGSADASAILNWNVLTVSGGTIESDGYCAILNCATSGTTYETGSVTITGGTFSYDASYSYSDLLAPNSTSTDVTVSGGSFSTVVDEAYCAEGYVPVTEQDEDGLYTVTPGYTVTLTFGYDGAEDETLYVATDDGTTTGSATLAGGTVADPERASYTFAGWTDASGAAVDLSEDQCITADTTYTATWSAAVASVTDADGEVTGYYSTVQAAIDAAESGSTVTLLQNATEDVTVSKTLTLDLNGCTLTGSSSHTISNKGTLTIVDSSESGSGAVVNNISSSAALANYPGGVCTIEGGSFSGNAWYVIKNLGTLTINGGSVTQNHATSSGIDNGWYGSTGNDLGLSASSYDDPTATLTINGGTFSGGVNVVKNDDYGVLVINGGTFTNTSGPTVLNWNVATINGGTFTVSDSASSVIANGYLSGGADEGVLTITGGTFISAENGTGYLFGYATSTSTGGSISITGGSFTGLLSNIVDSTAWPYDVEISGTTDEDGVTTTPTFSVAVDPSLCAEGWAPTTYDSTTGTYTVTTFSISLNEDTYAYTGSAIELDLTVTLNGTALTSGTGYTVGYADEDGTALEAAPTDAGTYTVTVTGVTYTGTDTFTITVTAKSLSSDDVTASLSATSFTYTGASQVPSVSVTDGETALAAGTDYTVSFASASSVDVGTYTVTVAGTGNYTGSVTLTYAITVAEQQLSYASESVSVHLNGTVENALTQTAVWGELSYASSDTTVATVAADGTVTLVGAGEATITATAASGSNYNSASASYTLTVTGHSYEAVVTDPTCTEQGYTTYTCSVCGDTYVDDYTDATGHTEGEAVVENEVAATCTQAGSYDTVVYCTVCGEEISRETVTVAATGHSWDEGTVTTEPTCTEAGALTYTCTVCGATKTEAVEATGHSYEAVVTDPTCTEQGYTAYTCTVCGDTYVDDYTDATGHTAGEAVTENEVAATCTQAGNYDTVTYCTVCGEELFRETVEVAATGHSWSDAVWTWSSDGSMATAVRTCTNDGCGYELHATALASNESGNTITSTTVEATCTEAGSTTYTAIVTMNGETLTDTKTVEIAATGHSYEAVVTDPTCTEQGYTTYTCTVCADTYVDDYTDATGHTAGEAVVENEVAPTCTEAGSYDSVTYCTVCGTEISRETVTVAATGHDYVSAVTTEATCTEEGVLTYTCQNDSSHTYTEAVAATGHTAGEAVVENEVAATCTEGGSYESVTYCTVCGEEISRETVTVAATGHSYSSVVTDPTCTEGGYTTYTCSVCGSTYTADETEATGHSWDEGTVTTAATCTDAGTMTYTCTVCGATTTEAIAATGHTAGETVTENEVAPTCTKAGSYDSVTYCTVCGEEISRETVTVAATGHSYDYAAATWTWTETADGYAATATATCTNDASHTVTLEAEVACAYTAATDSADAFALYTATITVDGTDYTSTKAVDATVYEVVDGADQTVYACSLAAVEVTADGAVDAFVGLLLDGSYLELGSDYTAAAGSTQVTITKAVLSTLELGEHALTFVYEDGIAETTLTVAEHDYVAVVTNPTCTEGGYTTYTCSVCGSTYTADETAATGHSWSAWTTSGTTQTRTCSVCGATETRELETTDLSAATVTLSDDSYTYDGIAKEPAVTVALGGAELTEGTDYTVSYSDNTSAGTATVTVTGTGTYTGTATATFTISPVVTRLWGATRYDTMAEIVAEAYEGETSEWAIIATGTNFPDALAAASLAGAQDAPIVLVADGKVDQALATLEALGVSKVYIVGGTAAVGTTVQSQIEALGIEVTRLAGDNRVETALAIAEEVLALCGSSASSTCFVAASATFPDALSASAYAYWTASPIYLANTDGSLSEEVLAAIAAGGYDHVIVLGGTAAVSSAAYGELGSLSGVTVTRLGGENRYETSALVAAWSVAQGMGYDGAAVATGVNFPDALVGATLCGRSGSVLLLARDANTTALDLLAENTDGVSEVYILGGTSVVSESLEEELVALLGA